MKKGDNNNRVFWLQELLQSVYNVYKNAKLDGDYGPKTEQAVKDYQEEHGEDITGEVTPQLAWGMALSTANSTFWLNKFDFYEKF